MIKDREKFIKSLMKQCVTFTADNNKKQYLNMCSLLTKRHGMDISSVCSITNEPEQLDECSDEFLYCLCKAMYESGDSKIITINPENYFTETQQLKYDNFYVDDSKEDLFPIVLNPVIEIGYNQWILKIDANNLCKFKEKKIINYNPNTQRSMIKRVRNDKAFYKIHLNKKSVNDIKKLMKENKYVSNTLTFNIPETENDFYYDEKSMSLIINSLKNFDIVDGYHRYVALCSNKMEDPNFNYPMELRIIHFSDVQCKNFIFQEDQRNKIKKIDSRSLNMNDVSNIITQRINEDPMCLLNGQITRNEGMISFAELSECIRFYLCSDVKPENKNLEMIQISKYLIDCFNGLVNFDESFINGKIIYDFKTLNIIIFIFAINKQNGMNEKEYKIIKEMINNKKLLDNRIFTRTSVSKISSNKLVELRKEVSKNV